MRLLVIGGVDGQVGRALSLMSSGDVAIIVRGAPEADLTKPETLSAQLDAVKPDAVACVGAYTAVDQAEDDEVRARAINALGPGELAKACAARGLPLVHISTDYVFDGAKPGAWVETDTPAPLNAYGRTKLEGEQLIVAAGGRHVILRASWVFADQGKNFVRTMLRLAATRDRLNVVDDQTGYPTYAPFIAQTIITVAQRMVDDAGAPSGVFHMAGEGTTSWRGFAQAIFEGARTRGGPFAETDPIPTSAYPTPAQRPINSAMNADKLARDYGVRLPHWRDGLAHCLDAIARDGWKVG